MDKTVRLDDRSAEVIRRIFNVVVLTSLAAFCDTAAYASWFARSDGAGKLVLTGVAINPDETNAVMYLTCEGDRLDIEAVTAFSAKQSELESYQGAKIILGYKTKDGERRRLGLDGEPRVLPGHTLSLVAHMSTDQSSKIASAIARGDRLDFELVHPELGSDLGVKKVFNDTLVSSFALREQCPGVKLTEL